MDIFKLIFEHDLRLDQLRERQTDRSIQETNQSLEAFLKPDPTYSKFYFTGTRLPEPSFGLNQLQSFPSVMKALNDSLNGYHIISENGIISFKEALNNAKIGEALILSVNENVSWDFNRLRITSDSNAGHKKEYLAEILQTDDLVLYKENAHHGYDLHLFSRKNIYPRLFNTFRNLVSDSFRYFSINGKRIRSEQKFYFETWTLDRPPHGAEEVFKETVL
ncbi:MAG: hypothetical protein WEA56_07765 [Balneolaceae bacterium]